MLKYFLLTDCFSEDMFKAVKEIISSSVRCFQSDNVIARSLNANKVGQRLQRSKSAEHINRIFFVFFVAICKGLWLNGWWLLLDRASRSLWTPFERN